jgi:peptidoglycan/xylan/chitin deacetylase (PgdA/CDA1 family)
MMVPFRWLLKVSALPWGLVRDGAPGIYFVIYHKIGEQAGLELELPFSLFRRQMEFFHRIEKVVPYTRALSLLKDGEVPQRDLFVLTFDDGYEDFYTEVYPLLQEFQLPAIVFVTTGFVEKEIGSPLTRPRQAIRPLSWEMLGRMQESGLVTLGAHTHTHPSLVGESEARVVQELERPIVLFGKRLGLEPKHFAYPRALWREKEEALVKCYYESAVIGSGQKATVDGFNPYRIPRLPMRASDGWVFFRARLGGWLEAEERFYMLLHKVARTEFAPGRHQG